MVNLVLRLLGDGSTDNPFGVNFPSWEMLAFDTVSKQAIVEVSPNDIPELLPTQSFAPPWLLQDAVPVVIITALDEVAFNNLIRQRYAEGFSEWDANEERGN